MGAERAESPQRVRVRSAIAASGGANVAVRSEHASYGDAVSHVPSAHSAPASAARQPQDAPQQSSFPDRPWCESRRDEIRALCQTVATCRARDMRHTPSPPGRRTQEGFTPGLIMWMCALRCCSLCNVRSPLHSCRESSSHERHCQSRRQSTGLQVGTHDSAVAGCASTDGSRIRLLFLYWYCVVRVRKAVFASVYTTALQTGGKNSDPGEFHWSQSFPYCFEHRVGAKIVTQGSFIGPRVSHTALNTVQPTRHVFTRETRPCAHPGSHLVCLTLIL